MYDQKKLDFGISGIYRIENIKNGKFYIGSAKCIRKRFNEHIGKLKLGTHPNRFFQNAFNKHGIEAFRAFQIQTVDDLAELIIVEQLFLDKLYDGQKLCYNICPTAGSALGRKHTEDTKRKISQAHKGKTLSRETRQKISEAKKKQKYLHFKSGIENPMYGKCGESHHFYGHTHSAKSKKKMSDSSKGIPNEKNGRQVFQYNLEGNLIRSFVSCAEAKRQTGVSGIRAVARGFRKTAGGFVWRYATD